MISCGELLSATGFALRPEQRRRLIAHGRLLAMPLGPAMRLQFEDELTVRYQIQEVLRIEKLQDADAVQHEIDTYAHLLPDGRHWRATLMIELPEASERSRLLPALNEAAQRLYVQAAGQPRAWAHANEDLPNRHQHAPSAVHFLRFELSEALRAALHADADVTLGCDHPSYRWRRSIPAQSLAQLRRDLAMPRTPSCLPAPCLSLC